MSDVRPFMALHPTADLADKVSAPPYDVLSDAEARAMAVDNPLSFLYVTKSEIGLDPSVDPYSDLVYKTASERLNKMEAEGALIQDRKPCYYIYSQSVNGHGQTGVAACVSVDEYLDGRIKKHELTTEKKERDRIKHAAAANANTGPIFLAHKPNADITSLIKNWTASHKPDYSFTMEDNVNHTVWTVDDDEYISRLRKAYASVESLYIADGHHRNASAAKVALSKREQNPGYPQDAEFNYYLAVLFSSDELSIKAYNRVVKSLNGHSVESLIDAVGKDFLVELYGRNEPYSPDGKHIFGMYLGKEWYKLTVKPGITDMNDPVASLDASILQTRLLAPVLGIDDPRTSDNIIFVGGIRGLKTLEDQADEYGGVSFSMYPTSMEDLFAVADSGKIMPPKSTWFEPKLRSGLFVHKLD